jgi:hypothetical protein
MAMPPSMLMIAAICSTSETTFSNPALSGVIVGKTLASRLVEIDLTDVASPSEAPTVFTSTNMPGRNFSVGG